MERGFFNRQIARLRERFDTRYNNAYTVDMLDTMFKKLKDVEDREFEQCVSRLLVTAKFKPLYNDFLEILRPSLNQTRQKMVNKLNEEAEYCPRCNNMGTVFRERKDTCPVLEVETVYVFAYKCTQCPRGELLAAGIPADKGF